MDMGLAGRVAIVTGAATGIGAAIAESLAGEGCIVWIADRDGDEAERAARDLAGRGMQARSVAMDVRREEEVAAAIAKVLDQDRKLDILVCNAGVLKTKTFRDSSPRDWQEVVDVNLYGVATCIRAAAEIMAAGKEGGRIVNIASVAAMRGGGSVGNTLYGTTKAAVVALTLGLAREFGPLGITVNAVAPAIAETRMTRASLTDEARQRILARIPLGRLATPADIADAVTFLTSDRARFINGAVLAVDGGILTT
jgi:3-oxoacyl-[acyl-carrier protein] reductase